MTVAAPLSPALLALSPAVMAGVLVRLAEWLDTGCPRAANQAALCLDHLVADTRIDPELAAACGSLLDTLEHEASS